MPHPVAWVPQPVAKRGVGDRRVHASLLAPALNTRETAGDASPPPRPGCSPVVSIAGSAPRTPSPRGCDTPGCTPRSTRTECPPTSARTATPPSGPPARAPALRRPGYSQDRGPSLLDRSATGRSFISSPIGRHPCQPRLPCPAMNGVDRADRTPPPRRPKNAKRPQPRPNLKSVGHPYRFPAPRTWPASADASSRDGPACCRSS